MTRYDDAISRIDANNGEDPTLVPADGAEIPAELAYGRRMSTALAALYPEASEELRLACRAQHIRRWTLPRNAYPMDRPGYHRWRTELKDRHARLAGEIMRECGYGDAQIARVEQLIRKENLKRDGESQALEDVACIVFLTHYIEEFAAKHDDAKLTGILRKTWGKMSDRGHKAAAQIGLPDRVGKLLAEALAG
jgi:uncharacterized protein DUF4202